MLRTLADELERAVVTINEEEYSIAPDVHAKLSLKAKGGTFSSKLKFKLENPLSEKEDGKYALSIKSEVENYKDLKKRMSIDFKTIKKSCIQEHVVPNPDLVERFFLDAKAMTSAIESLVQTKTDCHAKYK